MDKNILWQHRETLAQKWADAISPVDDLYPATISRYAALFTDEAINLLTADMLDREKTQKLGEALGELTHCKAASLGKTLEVLGEFFVQHIPSERFFSFLGELVTGFSKRNMTEADMKIKFTVMAVNGTRSLHQTIKNASLSIQQALRENDYQNSLLYVEKLEQANIDLSDFLTDILMESKKKSQKIELEPKIFNVAELIENLAQSTRNFAQKHNNTFQVQCDPELGQIFTDPIRLRQVLINLLSNACKFTENGKVVLSARRETESGQPRIVFTISDTGAGIPPERMKNLFDWSTIESLTSWGPVRQKGGRGLGLMISARLTELMNGSITVESEVGKGSTFSVILPAQQ